MQIYPQIQNFSPHLWHPDTDIGTKIFLPNRLKKLNLVYVQSGKSKIGRCFESLIWDG